MLLTFKGAFLTSGGSFALTKAYISICFLPTRLIGQEKNQTYPKEKTRESI